MRMMRWAVLGCLLVLGACSSGSSGQVAAVVARTTSTAVPATTTPQKPAVTSTATTPSTTTPSTTTPANPAAVATTTTDAGSTTTTSPPDIEGLARRVLMVGIRGETLRDGAAAHLAAGGRAVILFGENVGPRSVLSRLTSDIACAAGAPVLIAVDQELGRRVRRLGPSLVTPLPTPQQAQLMASEELFGAGRQLGVELLTLGINMNLAPVVDVVRGANPVLAGRHLGPDPEVVARVAVAFIAGMSDAGVVAVPKHFPGHGLSRTDPHGGAVVIDAAMEDLAAIDFVPFEAALDVAGAVMVGHPVYVAIDPDRPASLSPAVLDLLRNSFGFEGVAVTDSLSMRAVTAGRSAGEVAVAALAAGEDLLVVQEPSRIESSVEAIVAAFESGDITFERLVEAADRVERLAASAGQPECAGQVD